MDLSSIISVNISMATVTPSRANFGTPLVLGYHTRFSGSYRDYTSPNGMLSDGFTQNDQVYKLAESVFSQSPRPTSVRVARLPAPSTPHSSSLGLSGMADGQRVEFELVKPDGSVVTVDVPYSGSASATATAVAALDPLMSATGTNVRFTAASNGPRLFVRNISGFGSFRDLTGDWGYDTALTSLLNQSPAFYTVHIDVDSPANVADVAAWALANKRLYGASPQVTDPADYTATANALRLATNDRAYSVVTHSDPEGYAASALAGVCLVKNPGAATWAFKQLRDVQPSNWTESQINTLETDNTNYYVTVNNIPITFEGKTHSGEWIDVRRDVDWFTARLSERLLALQVNNDKVPFTNAGISMIANELRGQLKDAENAGVFDAGWTVTTPDVLSVPEADRNNRHLPGVEFEARLAGAIHTVTVTGRITQ